MDRCGGRVQVCENMRTCMVLDTPTIPDSLLVKLKAMHTRVDILADSHSLSGFKVRVQLRRDNFTRVVVTGAALACMSAVVAHCLKRDI